MAPGWSMRFAVTKSVASRYGIAAVVGLSLIVLFAAPGAFAESGTTISTEICGLSQTAHIVIVSPLPNTSTDRQTVSVTGELTQITQLTAYVDGHFSEVIPIDSHATTFTYQYLPPVGQHTLRLEGQDLCQRTTPVAELVLTYDPTLPPTPITGPTTTEPPITSAPVGTLEQASAPTSPLDNSNVGNTLLPSLLQPIGSGITDALLGLGIVSTNPAESTRMATRFALMTTGVLVIAFAGGVLKLAACVLPVAVKGGIISVVPLWVIVRARLLVGAVGVVLIVVGFLLAG